MMIEQGRIVVIAQPELGRQLESHFRAAGWSVYRSPDITSVSEILRSVRPKALIVGLDAPWFDDQTLPLLLKAADAQTCLLALTDSHADFASDRIIVLPTATDPKVVLREVNCAVQPLTSRSVECQAISFES